MILIIIILILLIYIFFTNEAKCKVFPALCNINNINNINNNNNNNNNNNKINCSVSTWGPCNGSIKTRTFKEGANGGKLCTPSEKITTEECNNCIISTWAPCNGTNRIRTFIEGVNGGITCTPEEKITTEKCNNCIVSNWSSCNNSTKTRTRTFTEATNGGTTCTPEEKVTTQSCSNCNVSEWGLCNGTNRTRTFTDGTNGGVTCTPEQKITVQTCNDCIVSTWSPCNGTEKTRQITEATNGGRQCSLLDNIRRESCVEFNSDCNVGEWGPCNGITRTRTVTQAINAGRACTATENITSQPCNHCIVGSWSCNGYYQTRTVTEASNGGTVCSPEQLIKLQIHESCFIRPGYRNANLNTLGSIEMNLRDIFGEKTKGNSGISDLGFPFKFFGLDVSNRLNWSGRCGISIARHFVEGSADYNPKWIIGNIHLGWLETKVQVWRQQFRTSIKDGFFIKRLVVANNMPPFTSSQPHSIMEIRIIKSSSNQYIEINIERFVADPFSNTIPLGTWGIQRNIAYNNTNGLYKEDLRFVDNLFYNNQIPFTNWTSNQQPVNYICILKSDLNGDNWTLIQNHHINI